MKKFAIVLGLIATACGTTKTSDTSSAAGGREPLSAFRDSTDVKEAIQAINQRGFSTTGAIKQATLRGQCGFAGCGSTEIVGQAFSTPGANTQTDSVVALIETPAVGQPTFVGLAVIMPAGSTESVETADQSALEAFNNSAAVKAAIASLTDSHAVAMGPAVEIELTGSCGFAGCGATILVVQTMKRGVVNASTYSVAATIKIPSVRTVSKLEVTLAKIFPQD